MFLDRLEIAKFLYVKNKASDKRLNHTCVPLSAALLTERLPHPLGLLLLLTSASEDFGCGSRCKFTENFALRRYLREDFLICLQLLLLSAQKSPRRGRPLRCQRCNGAKAFCAAYPHAYRLFIMNLFLSTPILKNQPFVL